MNAASHDALGPLFEHDRAAVQRMLDDVAYLRRRGSYQSACKVFGELRRLIDQRLGAARRTACMGGSGRPHRPCGRVDRIRVEERRGERWRR